MVVATAPTLAVEDAATLLAAAADPVRWRILAGLGARPRCVCEIQADVGISPSLLSYHLRVLRDAGLVTTRRRGRWIDYALEAEAHDRLAAALPTR